MVAICRIGLLNAPFTMLESTKRSWHGPRMAQDRNIQAPGVILAGAIMLGAVGGVIVGESSAGFLIGLAAGLIVTGIYWLRQRRR